MQMRRPDFDLVLFFIIIICLFFLVLFVAFFFVVVDVAVLWPVGLFRVHLKISLKSFELFKR